MNHTKRFARIWILIYSLARLHNKREWFKKASPYLQLLTGTLGMVLPVASSAVKLALDETAYKLIEEQLDFGKSIIDATLGGAAKKGKR